MPIAYRPPSALIKRDGRRIQHRNAVPQDVAAGRAHEERALADRKGRLRPDADHAGLVLAVRS